MPSFHKLKTVLPFLAILAVSIAGCEKAADEVNFELNTPVPNDSDTTRKTFRFSFTGNVEAMVLFSGETGEEFRFSHLWLNSQDFKEKLQAEGAYAGLLEYIYVDPTSSAQGLTSDTFDIVYMPLIEDGVSVDYCWTILEDKYAGREYVRAIKPEIMSTPYDTVLSVSLSKQNEKLISYNTGIPIDANLRYVDKQYTEAGSKTATMVGTNVGRKQYEGDGYQTDRRYFVDDYDITHSYQDIEIRVGEELILTFVSGNAKNLRFSVQEEMKEKAKNLEITDFELRDIDNNIIEINTINYLGDFVFLNYDFELKPKEDFIQGATYKIRPINTFYGEFIECVPFP